MKVKPHQCTLVPDVPSQLTSDYGWQTLEHRNFLTEVISELKAHHIRVSLFCDPVNGLSREKSVGADRIEFTWALMCNYHTKQG